MDKCRFILVNNRLPEVQPLSKRCMKKGWFLDKKPQSKKIFVYTHSVPVDIQVLTHRPARQKNRLFLLTNKMQIVN